MKKQSKKDGMKYEKTKFKLPTKLKKQGMRRFKKIKSWVGDQAGRSDFRRTGDFLFGIFTMVCIWAFFWWIWSEYNEALALFNGLLVVVLSLPWIFRPRRW